MYQGKKIEREERHEIKSEAQLLREQKKAENEKTESNDTAREEVTEP